jgi:predicted ribosome quality control (RQC) complex YloA/Tae2 family protein
VIIRCGNRPKPPEIVLERAAQLAAYNSSAKGSEWVPVMITERKYVRKKKGLAAGEVIVERETTVMAEPVR